MSQPILSAPKEANDCWFYNKEILEQKAEEIQRELSKSKDDFQTVIKVIQ